MPSASPQSTAAIPTAARADVILRATNLHRTFKMGDTPVQVLQGTDLTLRRGEFVAIEGRSGSGKSTLLHILGALDGIDSGTTIFDGRDYARLFPAANRWGGVTGKLLGGLDSAAAAVVRFSLLATWRWLIILILGAVILGMVLTGNNSLAEQFANLRENYSTLGRMLLVGCLWIAGAGVLFLALTVVKLLIALVIWLLATLVRGVAISAHAIRHPSETWDAISRRLSRASIASDLRNHQFGFVFQFYYLLPELDVLENTLLSPMVGHSSFSYLVNRRALKARAITLLNDLGLSHRLTHRPNQLSGGERQRVAIARALMNEPKILFADEPTGNLDVETGRQIMNVLEKLHREKGQTIVMVTHDRALAREADRVLVLKNGKLEKAE